MPPTRPRVDADERDSLQAWLEFQRRTLIGQAEGLSDDESRLRHPPSELSIQGLIRHLAEGERWWFRLTFAGEQIGPQWSTDDDRQGGFHPAGVDTLAEAVAAYREECDVVNDLIAGCELAELAAGAPAELGGLRPSLRWIITHMIEETARHNGHADLILEAIHHQVRLE